MKEEIRKILVDKDTNAMNVKEACSLFKSPLTEALTKIYGKKRIGKELFIYKPWEYVDVKDSIIGKRKCCKNG